MTARVFVSVLFCLLSKMLHTTVATISGETSEETAHFR